MKSLTIPALILLLILGILTNPLYAKKKAKNVEEYPDISMCFEDAYGLELYCETGWMWKRVGDTVMIIMNENPRTTLMLKRGNEKIKFLGQVSKMFLDKQGLYGNGYRTEEARIADERSVKVKAFSSDFPNMRLLDYYFMHNSNLYSLHFSVEPKEAWEEQQFLIKKVVDSIKFVD